ncbi:MAG: hypothetical protein K6G42_07715 [Lachnospiraceae bacterium]|nr:hypothetical protein [Lachnospiraceae bacterium]
MYKRSEEDGNVRYKSVDISEAEYYVAPDGRMVTGWYTGTDDKQYYFSTENGKKLTGVHKIGTSRYYFEETGAASAKRDEWTDDGKYYVTAKGTLQTGWQTVGGEKYYFDKTTGCALIGIQQVKGIWYEFGADGILARV